MWSAAGGPLLSACLGLCVERLEAVGPALAPVSGRMLIFHVSLMYTERFDHSLGLSGNMGRRQRWGPRASVQSDGRLRKSYGAASFASAIARSIQSLRPLVHDARDTRCPLSAEQYSRCLHDSH